MYNQKIEFQYEIVKHLGTLSTNSKGWHREFNLVSWNGGAPKYDLRNWDENHEKMGKGISLTEPELRALKALLVQHFPDSKELGEEA
ncbi:MAG: PC4/YdbC family ssDNA-binding protein [Acidaminococcaceae bacterium]